jgi:hypothetical protein
MSSFQVATTTVLFTVNQDNFSERHDTLLRTWELELYLALAADYATLRGLLSYPVHVGVAPGTAGATMYVDIGGGAGQGTLTIDNVVDSPFTAALTRLDRPSAFPGGGRRCRATFQECPT